MILVFSGGGMKGIAYIGVLKALEELEFIQYFDTFSGASVGSLILLLYLLGYTASELLKLVIGLDINKLKSIDLFGLFNNFGIDNGNKLMYVVKKLFKKKNIDENITMKEFYELTNKTLYMSTVCLNTGTIEYLSHKTHPSLQILKAVRMSTAIPWFYTPVNHDNKLYIDGGVIDNYPITIFKDQIHNVLGIYLLEHDEGSVDINNIEIYSMRVMQCFFNGINCMKRHGYEEHTIDIHMELINILNYDIDKHKKLELYNKGYQTIIDRFNPSS